MLWRVPISCSQYLPPNASHRVDLTSTTNPAIKERSTPMPPNTYDELIVGHITGKFQQGDVEDDLWAFGVVFFWQDESNLVHRCIE